MQTQYRITEATQHGQLYKGEVALKVGSVFTQAELDAGLIKYVHNGGEVHEDFFKYTVSDGDYTVNDGDNPGAPGTIPDPAVFRIEIKPANDSPEIVSRPSVPIVVDGENIQIDARGFEVADKDLANGAGTDLITAIVRVVDLDGAVVSGVVYALHADLSGLSGVHVGHGNRSGSAVSASDYLLLTGSVSDINAALEKLKVSFGDGVADGKYRLQLIVDDRLNAAGTAYQNGGDGVTANGGDKNHQNGLHDVDAKVYDWTAQKVDDGTSFNLSVTHQDIWVSIQNEAPELNVPGSVTVQEDVPFKLTGITVVDPESTTFGTPVSLNLSVDSGTLQAKGLPSGVTVSGSGGTVTLTGSVQALNAYLASDNAGTGVFYTSAPNVNHDVNEAVAGDVTLTVTFSEKGTVNSGNPGSGGSVIGGSIGDGSVGNADVVRTVAITIDAVNDAPTVTAPSGILTIDSSEWKNAGTFSLADVDANEGYATGEQDGIIQITVRVLGEDGEPLELAVYAQAGIRFQSSTSGHGAVSDTVFNGIDSALRIYGTLEAVQAYIDGLQVQFANPGGANLDGTYRLEVVVDDRLYEKSGDQWALKLESDLPVANGGGRNQNGTGEPGAVPGGAAFDPYNDKVSGYGIYNVVGASRELFISSINDPAEIGIGNEYSDEESSLSDVETQGRKTVTLNGLTIRDSDAQPTDVLDVTIALPEGFIFQNHANGALASDSRSITLSGTLAQINSWLSGVTIELPDVDGDAEAQDWNGSFEFTVVVNDRGNTGVTPTAAPDGKNGNTFTIGAHDGKSALITTRTLTFVVSPTNDAPVVNEPGARETLPAVDEDFTGEAAPAGGQTVSDLFGKYFDDSRDGISGRQPAGGEGGSASDTFWGVAIVGTNSADGVWQYNDGTGWKDLPGDIGEGKAFVLKPTDSLRFLPDTDYNGTPDAAVTVRLIDASEGPVDSSVRPDLSGANAGGTTPYSAEVVVLTVAVMPENDRPVFTVDGKTGGIEVQAAEEEDKTGEATSIDVPLLSNVAVSDIDLGTTPGLDAAVFGAGRITVGLNGFIPGDALRLDAVMAGMAGAAAYDASAGVLTILLAENATLEQVTSVLEAIRYVHTTDDPTNETSGTPRASLGFTVTLSDGKNAQQGGRRRQHADEPAAHGHRQSDQGRSCERGRQRFQQYTRFRPGYSGRGTQGHGHPRPAGCRNSAIRSGRRCTRPDRGQVRHADSRAGRQLHLRALPGSPRGLWPGRGCHSDGKLRV